MRTLALLLGSVCGAVFVGSWWAWTLEPGPGPLLWLRWALVVCWVGLGVVFLRYDLLPIITAARARPPKSSIVPESMPPAAAAWPAGGEPAGRAAGAGTK